MKSILFTDIDDTLMQTEKKCAQWLTSKSISPENVWQVGAVDKAAQPLSYVMPAQKQLLKQFSHCEIIPVTGRNKAALDRVDIPFTSYQIVDHGAIIIGKNGLIDDDWQVQLEPKIAAWVPLLNQYQLSVARWIAKDVLPLRSRVIEDFSIPCYVSIKGDERALENVAQRLKKLPEWEPSMRIHINGHNMALLPPYACKRAAVLFLQNRFKVSDSEVLFLAAGDSTSDLPFMSECHFQIIPPTSQIQKICLNPSVEKAQ